MGLLQLNFAGLNKIEVAVMRLKEFEPPEGYYFADSGGKDSCTVRNLLQVSGVAFDAHYSQGGIDPPELVYFIRQYHPDTIAERPTMSVWKGVLRHGMPRRQGRWCCELIKEQAGSGRIVVTGVRWQESVRRRNRQMVETCYNDSTKRFLHPIIDWSSNEVWEYLAMQRLPYCSLYDEGASRKYKGDGYFKRLGCVLCPMETRTQTLIELLRFPKLAGAWKRAAYRYYEKGTESVSKWPDAESFWQWWLSRKGLDKRVSQNMFD